MISIVEVMLTCSIAGIQKGIPKRSIVLAVKQVVLNPTHIQEHRDSTTFIILSIRRVGRNPQNSVIAQMGAVANIRQ